MYGIENIKKSLKFLIKLGMEIDEALEDGKINIFEGIGFADNLLPIPALIENAETLKEEIKDLSDSEQAELTEYVRKEFDLNNDHTEAYIEYGFETLTSLTQIVNGFRALPKK